MKKVVKLISRKQKAKIKKRQRSLRNAFFETHQEEDKKSLLNTLDISDFFFIKNKISSTALIAFNRNKKKGFKNIDSLNIMLNIVFSYISKNSASFGVKDYKNVYLNNYAIINCYANNKLLASHSMIIGLIFEYVHNLNNLTYAVGIPVDKFEIDFNQILDFFKSKVDFSLGLDAYTRKLKNEHFPIKSPTFNFKFETIKNYNKIIIKEILKEYQKTNPKISTTYFTASNVSNFEKNILIPKLIERLQSISIQFEKIYQSISNSKKVNPYEFFDFSFINGNSSQSFHLDDFEKVKQLIITRKAQINVFLTKLDKDNEILGDNTHTNYNKILKSIK